MAKSDIHVTVEGMDGGGKKGSLVESTSDKAVPLSGVTKKEESTEDLFERLSDSLTKEMKSVCDLLSGKNKDSPFSAIKSSAEKLLGSIGLFSSKDEDEESDSGKKEEGDFEKATKVMGLKPSDINIVDQQYILGSLLVNSTLLRIEDIMSDYIKKQGGTKKEKLFGRKKGKKGEGGESDAPGIKAKAPKGKFAEGLSNFMNLMKTMPGLLVSASKSFKGVKWRLLNSSIKKSKLFIKNTLPLIETFEKNRKKFKTFNKLVKPFVEGLKALTKGIAFIGIMLPFIALGSVSAKILNKAIPTLVKIADKIDKEKKKFVKFKHSAQQLSWGLIALVPGMVALALLAPFLILGVISAALLIPTLLLLGIAIKFLPKPATLLKGLLSALLLNLVVASLALSVIMIAPLGPKFKDTMIGLGTITIVAVAGTLLAALLGIPVILPLVAMGALTALSLAVFFIGIAIAAKAAIKAGKLAPEAASAIGFISKKSANTGDNDGTESKEESGIFGFLSKIGCWTFFKILLKTVGVAALMAVVGGVLLFGALMITGALKQFNKIGTELFPAGVEFSQTGPGSGVLGVIRFLRTITGRVDFNGNPLPEPEPVITFGDLFALLPLLGFALLLKLAAKQLQGAVEEFGKLAGDPNLKNSEKAVESLKGFLKAADGLIDAAVGDDKPGLIGWILGFVFGENVTKGLTLLGKMFPLLMLSLYGKVLSMAAKPLKEGLDALGSISGNELDDNKITNVVSILGKVMDKIQSYVKFGTNESNYEHVANAVGTASSAMVDIVEGIMKLVNVSSGKLDDGIRNYNTIIDKVFGNKKTGTGILAKMEDIKDGCKIPKATFEQVSVALDKTKPLVDAVIEMAKFTPQQIDAGVSAITKIFDLVASLSGGGGEEGSAQNFMGVLGSFMDVMGTKAETNAMDHNPVFKMIELFADTKKLEAFDTGAQAFSKSTQVVIDVMKGLDDNAIKSIESFSASITNSGVAQAIDSTVRFIQAEAPLARMATSFQSIANSLGTISDNSGALDSLNGIGSINVGEVAEAQAATNVNTQVAGMGNAMEMYVQRMSSIMEQWNAMGVPLQQGAAAPAPLAGEPSYNSVGNGAAFEGGF